LQSPLYQERLLFVTHFFRLNTEHGKAELRWEVDVKIANFIKVKPLRSLKIRTAASEEVILKMMSENQGKLFLVSDFTEYIVEGGNTRC
jgi:hypothetical protein